MITTQGVGCRENLICVGARRNHLSERDDRPDVLLLWAIHLTLKSRIRLEAEDAILRHQWIALQRKMRSLRQWRSVILHSALSPVNVGGASDHPAGYLGAAACRFSLLLALEVPIGRWSAPNRCGSGRVDPTDERRQSAVGRSTYFEVAHTRSICNDHPSNGLRPIRRVASARFRFPVGTRSLRAQRGACLDGGHTVWRV
jgi:hypothetical protein